jgi:hypothetical protein
MASAKKAPEPAKAALSLIRDIYVPINIADRVELDDVNGAIGLFFPSDRFSLTCGSIPFGDDPLSSWMRGKKNVIALLDILSAIRKYPLKNGKREIIPHDDNLDFIYDPMDGNPIQQYSIVKTCNTGIDREKIEDLLLLQDMSSGISVDPDSLTSEQMKVFIRPDQSLTMDPNLGKKMFIFPKYKINSIISKTKEIHIGRSKIVNGKCYVYISSTDEHGLLTLTQIFSAIL